MNRQFFPHDMDLGGRVDGRTIEMLLVQQRDSELVRGILQMLRNHAAMLERMGRQTPPQANGLEYRAYHAGGADAVEELLMLLWGVANPHLKRAAATEESDGEPPPE